MQRIVDPDSKDPIGCLVCILEKSRKKAMNIVSNFAYLRNKLFIIPLVPKSACLKLEHDPVQLGLQSKILSDWQPGE